MFYFCNYSDADLPELSSKDTQTESSGDDNPLLGGAEKSDEDKSDKKEPTKHWSIDRIKKEYRKFNIDLAPKVIYHLLLLISTIKLSLIIVFKRFSFFMPEETW